MPPNLRLVVPSACWNASKISRCLSFGIPMPVSAHREGDDRPRCRASGFANRPRLVRAPDRERDAALLGELERVREQVLEHLLQPLAVGVDRRRNVRRWTSNVEAEALLLGQRTEAAVDVSRTSVTGTSVMTTSIFPASTFDRGRARR